MSSLPNRKGLTNNPGSLVGVAQQRATSATLTSKQELPSSRYLDAINILCEATMDEACALLLSEKDYEEGNSDNSKSDYQKLLEIEQKCRDATKVVHKEAIQAPATMLPPSMPHIKKGTNKPMTIGGAAPKGLIGKTIAPMAAVSGKGSMSMRRGSMSTGRPAGFQSNKRTMTQQLQRAESDDSGNTATNKKARLAGGLTKSSSSSSVTNTTDKGDAPPASALNFLKRLNQDKTADDIIKEKNNGISRKKENKSTDSDESESSDVSEDEGRRNSPPPREGVRKNPARGARP